MTLHLVGAWNAIIDCTFNLVIIDCYTIYAITSWKPNLCRIPMHKYVICMLTYIHICMYFKLVNQHTDTFVSISVPSPRGAGTLSWFPI